MSDLVIQEEEGASEVESVKIKEHELPFVSFERSNDDTDKINDEMSNDSLSVINNVKRNKYPSRI